MKAEMIKELQENVKPFCKMAKDMQAKLVGIGKKGNVDFLDIQRDLESAEWVELDGDSNNKDYSKWGVYQLRSNYQPEPEVIRCEVVVEDGYICYRQGKGIFPFIDTVLRNPKWIGSEDKNGVFLGEVIRLRPPFEDCDTKSLTKPAEWVKYVLFAKGD